MGLFDHLEMLAKDPVFGLVGEYKQDPRKEKLSLVLGYYLSKELKLPILKSVSTIEKRLLENPLPKGYLPIPGDQEFVQALSELIFGKKTHERLCGVQTVGATGALYLSGKLARFWTKKGVIPNPTWLNHKGVFTAAGLEVTEYPYYESRKICFEKLIDSLQQLENKTLVLFHTSCHNPTGFDFDLDQWRQIIEVVERKQLFPVLDMAYHGFADTLEEEAKPVRLFFDRGLEFALTYTCAKNFSIYGERAGALFVVCDDPSRVDVIRSHLISIIRSTYSNPPIHPALIVKGILNDHELKRLWIEELDTMRHRMRTVRKAFVERMVAKDPEGNWGEVEKGRGLFAYSDCTKEQVLYLKKEKGIFIAADGRINLTGLNEENLDRVCDALMDAKTDRK